MQVAEIIQILEQLAPISYQESYDNCGLITGNQNWDCLGVLCTLDATEEVVLEAIDKKCNLIVAHHPILFQGIKKLNGKNYVERAIITAIKNDIAIYAIHTNLDNILSGVNNKMADQLGLIKRQILQPKSGLLQKLFVFVPIDYAEQLKQALFNAGAGNIGKYEECSFSSYGVGTFNAKQGSNPFTGNIGERKDENEIKLEVIFPAHLQTQIIAAMKSVHPYEEVAYDIVNLANEYQEIGSGLVGELEVTMDEISFLKVLQNSFGLKAIKHTRLLGKQIKKVAICGGAGSFLIKRAISVGADIYITADVKYHEFFDADGRLVIADIGHWESEQFTVELLINYLNEKCPGLMLKQSETKTNPIEYFITE